MLCHDLYVDIFYCVYVHCCRITIIHCIFSLYYLIIILFINDVVYTVICASSYISRSCLGSRDDRGGLMLHVLLPRLYAGKIKKKTFTATHFIMMRCLATSLITLYMYIYNHPIALVVNVLHIATLLNVYNFIVTHVCIFKLQLIVFILL